MFDDAFNRPVLAACIAALDNDEKLAPVLDDPALQIAERDLNEPKLIRITVSCPIFFLLTPCAPDRPTGRPARVFRWYLHGHRDALVSSFQG